MYNKHNNSYNYNNKKITTKEDDLKYFENRGEFEIYYN